MSRARATTARGLSATGVGYFAHAFFMVITLRKQNFLFYELLQFAEKCQEVFSQKMRVGSEGRERDVTAKNAESAEERGEERTASARGVEAANGRQYTV